MVLTAILAPFLTILHSSSSREMQRTMLPSNTSELRWPMAMVMKMMMMMMVVMMVMTVAMMTMMMMMMCRVTDSSQVRQQRSAAQWKVVKGQLQLQR